MMLRAQSGLLAASAILALSVALAPVAQAQGPANTDPAATKAGTYAVEPDHTQVMFALSHMGFTTYFGAFSGASGALTLDPANPGRDALQITVPIDSIHTTSAKLDEELKGADWFDAAKYPTATFRSTAVTVTGPGQADVAGELTLHGVTRPVTLHAHFNGAGVNMLDHAYTAGFQASGHIRRSEFGVSKYVPLVGDQVELILSGAFERRP